MENDDYAAVGDDDDVENDDNDFWVLCVCVCGHAIYTYLVVLLSENVIYM